MIEGLQVKSIEDIVDDMTDAYTKGDYLDGYTQDSVNHGYIIYNNVDII